MGKEQEFLTQLKWYAYWQLNQGYDEYKSLYQVIYLTISRSRLCNITYLDEVVLSSY